MKRCTFHPSQAVVGICSSCLRERLVSLARANYEQRRGEKNYKPDSLSWGYLPFQKRNYDDIEEIRDNDQRAKMNTQNYNSSDEKKGKKVNFSGLRSFLGFLRKRDCRNNVSVRGRRENELQRRQDRSGDVQGNEWINAFVDTAFNRYKFRVRVRVNWNLYLTVTNSDLGLG